MRVAAVGCYESRVTTRCRNDEDACVDRPVITCDNTDDLVLYVKEANSSRVYFDDNCIVVEGSGFDLIKGIDRILYDFYEIIE